jgi:hypothetical protein
MSCTLLEKLAAETRVRIYEYVLAFDTPVKHANKMRPFVGKFTRAASGSGLKQMPFILKELAKAGSKFSVKGKAAQGSERSDVDGSLRRIDTSILTTCKLVYKEAIAVFYTSNTIHFEAQLYKRSMTLRPRQTDLSLATRVVITLDRSSVDTSAARIRTSEVSEFATLMMPKLFPSLHTGTVYIHSQSAAQFIAEFRVLRSAVYRKAISFDTPGSMVATFHAGEPCVKVIMQCKGTMQRWTSPTVHIPPGPLTMYNASANLLYRNTRAGGLADPQNRYAELARLAFHFTDTHPELNDGPVESDSSEFWTVVDSTLSLFQPRS